MSTCSTPAAASCSCLSVMNLSLSRSREAASFCTKGFNNTVPALRSSGSGFLVDFGIGQSYGVEQSARPAFTAAAAASSNASPAASKSSKKRNIYEEDAKVIQVHTVKEFEDALVAAKDKLVVVEYAASTSPNSRKMYPAMVELSMTCQDAVFILVMGDESGETRQLCERLNIQKVPHFVFYKNQEIIHEEEGIGPDELLGDVLYYGDPDAPIRQLHSKKDLQDLMNEHSEDGKLIVLDVGLKHCGPCVKVYPTFVKLAKKMSDTSVFARINGDENEELMDLLRKMKVVEVPTFVFIRNKIVCGRYVGSGKGELIGEILRYQGVRVTY